MLPTSLPQRQQLRQQLRARRRALTPGQQAVAAQQLAHQLHQQSWFQASRRILVYLPNDGEIDPLPLVKLALTMNKEIYLPVLHPLAPRLLWLVRWLPGSTPMEKNRFGIPEPRLKGYGLERHRQIPPWAVDSVLLPLVGFDRQGGRLGMGGGFYDRTFDIRKSRPRQPRLIGLAHTCQEVDSLPVAAWDVPLQGIVTPEAFYPAKGI
ncbi:5-formyltetrahydrofolate cyclo-ligase [Marinospirillum perlucidum]|uniref:5-formyltetrahydrofolate cyclo-ligase n=1 Tax=Marinospirillum perlucidum TaxID=1982602 RepID=UPI000DF32CEA|nr:5-formyltetrahydrofolate cyclo-ligase [Marinospirillum perlucidum]